MSKEKKEKKSGWFGWGRKQNIQCFSLKSSKFSKLQSFKKDKWRLMPMHLMLCRCHAEQTMSTDSVGSYLFPIFTTSCLQLFPLLPLHGVWRRCVVGVDIQLLRVGQRWWDRWCLEELRWSVGQEEGEGGHRSVRRPQVINVQAVPVTSLWKQGKWGGGLKCLQLHCFGQRRSPALNLFPRKEIWAKTLPKVCCAFIPKFWLYVFNDNVSQAEREKEMNVCVTVIVGLYECMCDCYCRTVWMYVWLLL